MKKISLILLSLIFISCSNLFENILSERADAEENEQNTEQNQPESPLSQSPDSPQSPQSQEQPQNQSFVLSGSMVLDGAMPSIYSDAEQGEDRSANPTLASSEVEYFVYGTDSSGNKIEGSFGSGADSKTFSIGLVFGREWTITCGMRKTSGSKEEFLTASSNPKTYTVNNYTDALVLYPLPATSGKGEVSLSMTIPPSITNVTVSCISSNSADWTISNVAVTPGSGSTNGTALLQTGTNDDEKIKSGVYKISLSFFKGSDLVFQTTQSINVFYGLLTNQWYDASASGTSSAINNGSFVLTENLVKLYIATNFYVGQITGAALPSDTNAGTHKAPFETLTRALAQIESYGNPENNYKIHISSLVFPDNGASAGFEIPSSFDTKMNSLTLVGVTGNTTDIIDGDNRFTALSINTSKKVYIKNLKITEGKAASGGGILVGSNGDVSIDNCIITNNAATTIGGGILSYGTVEMTSTDIKANKAKQFGYGICVASGSFTMNSGEVSGNIFDTSSEANPPSVLDSGAVFVKKDAEFNFDGGTIMNNDSRAIYNHGTVNMTDGTISGHTAPRGGGIYNNGSLSISGGTITDNHAATDGDAGNGGGIYINAATAQTGDTPAVTPTFTMTGGTISENTAKFYGGGIANNSTATISGGEISGNYVTETSACGGGGIATFVNLTLESNAYIPSGDDNKNDIYLYDSSNGSTQFHIKIGQTLNHSNVALLTPAAYTQGRTMISKAQGSSANLAAEAAKFNVKSESYEGDWEISSTGLLNQVPSLGKIGTTYYVNLSALLAAITGAGESETLDITLYGALTASQLGKAATEGTVINAIKTTAAKVNLIIDSNAQIKPSTCVQLFTGCNNLLTADLRGLDTSDITSFSYMFNGCSNLTSLDVSSFNTAKVTIMSNMFNGCKKLSSLDVSSFDTSSVINMSGMFNECEVITSLDLSFFDTANVTTMDQMFRNSSALTTIIVSDTFETSSVTSSSNMFAGCTSLMGGASTGFSSSHLNASYAHIDEGTENPGYFTEREYYAKVNNVFYDDFDTAYAAIKDATGNIFVVVSDNATSTIGSSNNTNNITNAIRNTSATSVSFSVARGKTINLTSCSSLFDSCNRLKSADLRGFNTTEVSNYTDMFKNCTNLESVNLSSFNTSNATILTCFFRECEKLTTIDLSSFDTSNVTAMNQMFRNCKAVEKIIVSDKFVTTKVTSYSSIFQYCTTQLKGGAGTTWAQTLIDAIGYARIDSGSSAPGLFTSNTPDQVVTLGTKEVTGSSFDGTTAVSGSKVFVENRAIGTIKPITVSDHEVTQGEYETYCIYGGDETKRPTTATGKGVFYPAYYISWYDAITYCNLRSKADNLTPVYSITVNDEETGNPIQETDPSKWPSIRQGTGSNAGKYCGPSESVAAWNAVKFNKSADGWRLPTEIEWEYLARNADLTGTQYTYSGNNNAAPVCWYQTVSGGKAQYVEKLQKNNIDLYDMSGNVWEWCWDLAADDNALAASTPITGTEASGVIQRECRGGGYNSAISNCTVALRYKRNPYSYPSDVGFRVVRGALCEGSKLPSELKEVGDIVFNDGSATPYTELASLTNAQKAKAIAIIFYKGTGLNDGADTSTERTLGVSLIQHRTGVEWCNNGNAQNMNITSIECIPDAGGSTGNYTFENTNKRNGSNNFAKISAFLAAAGTGLDDTTNAIFYPLFYFFENTSKYSETLSGSIYANGWYIPSLAELYQLYVCRKNVFNIGSVSEALGGQDFDDDYWSSSQYDEAAHQVSILNLATGQYTSMDKDVNVCYACVIHEF